MMGVSLSRRGLLAAFGLAPAACAALPSGPALSSARAPSEAPFAHGVASGDPRETRVILWTRLTREGPGEAEVMIWEIAATPDFAAPLQTGQTTARAADDWCVHVDAGGLEQGRGYYFRFRWNGHVSPTGRTRTLPAADAASLRLATVSCAHYSHGYFNAYDHLARRDDIDLVIHLGDYLYGAAPGDFEGAPQELPGRRHDPPHEVVTLEDYRRRHAQYKRDGALQALHGAHPVIPSWDDHEITNNASRRGAPGFEGSAADWQARREAALKAWYEWMPVRTPVRGPAEARFKALKLGRLATLAVLETRLAARSPSLGFAEAAAYQNDPAALRAMIADPAREKLGTVQRAALEAAFADAADGWMILANQTMMAEVATPDVFPYLSDESIGELRARWDGADGFLAASRHALPLMLDAWDGYPAEREVLYGLAQSAGTRNLLVLTGDTHAWWANQLASADGTQMGVELAVSSVTAPSAFSPELLGPRARDFALLVNRANPAVRYVNGTRHGYLELTLEPDRAEARFMAVDTVADQTYRVAEQARFAVPKRGGGLALRRPRGLGLRERLLF